MNYREKLRHGAFAQAYNEMLIETSSLMYVARAIVEDGELKQGSLHALMRAVEKARPYLDPAEIEGVLLLKKRTGIVSLIAQWWKTKSATQGQPPQGGKP